MSKKLFIATQDPYNYGGVLTMAEFIYKVLKQNNWTPILIYNLIPKLRNSNLNDISLINFLLYKKQPIVLKEKFNEMNSIGIQRVAPLFEIFNYILNLKQWKNILQEGNKFFAVGGSALVALPFVFLKKEFLIWVATTLYEDRIDRIKRENFLRKLRFYLQLPILLYFEKLIFKKAITIFALSDYTKNLIIKKYKISPEKIKILRCPIEIDKFQPINYENRKNDYLLFTGRINDERKNINLLLKVFAKLKKEFPWLKLKLIGEMPNKKIYKLVQILNLKDSVEFINYIQRQDLINYYQNALFFVIPSLQEGLCISGLESLACGVPLVSTRCGGPEGYIIEGYNGFLTENNNEKDLFEKIKMYIKMDNGIKKRLCENARKYIVKNYNTEIIQNQFLDYLNE